MVPALEGLARGPDGDARVSFAPLGALRLMLGQASPLPRRPPLPVARRFPAGDRHSQWRSARGTSSCCVKRRAGAVAGPPPFNRRSATPAVGLTLSVLTMPGLRAVSGSTEIRNRRPSRCYRPGDRPGGALRNFTGIMALVGIAAAVVVPALPGGAVWNPLRRGLRQLE